MKMSMNPNWAGTPIISFPPLMHQQALIRPLHVWGHPSVEQLQLVPVWPRLPWDPPRPPHARLQPDPSYLHHPPYHRPLTQGTPCFPPVMPVARFSAPPVSGIPPHPMFRPAPHNVAPPRSKHSAPSQIQQPDAQPSNESIDAAIGDVLAKPWLPLPLGLKPPSSESVMLELHKQGVADVPPSG
ncbi:uncharacterized protein A4U43_C01F18530 [Asparagus officinalis]|uniref:Uncharacterized protein n=2 Tax=Asparagus officinalis TaxID=4686 RepID=A0A5P1FQC9_ASPOF|nr:uncharacterized protein A4U43_C01F18530 [Asparagus officinalis]